MIYLTHILAELLISYPAWLMVIDILITFVFVGLLASAAITAYLNNKETQR